MKFVHILVEGQTEETFVRDVLQPHLLAHDIHLQPKLAVTKRVRGRSDYKGGIVSYGKVKNDIQLLLYDTSAIAVTTMIDFYGLAGKGFPGWDTMKGLCYEKVGYVEAEIAKDVSHKRFRPYLALHEFEALLFCKPDVISRMMLNENPEVAAKLEAIRKQVASPEEINLDDPPSRRIQAMFPQYNKVADGTLIALDIGLDTMRAACPHFHEWVTFLETL